jgi:hypothetical protein
VSARGRVRADTGERTELEREENYPTPPWCVHRLLDELELPRGGHWFEPCAGEGSIVRAANSYYQGRSLPAPAWSLCEIREECRAGMLQLAKPEEVFLGDIRKISEDLRLRTSRKWAFDVAVTNPPYSLAGEIIAHCRLLAPIVIMLLRMNFLASEKRAELHRRCLPEKTLILPNRPSFKVVVRDLYKCLTPGCSAKLSVEEDSDKPSCPKCAHTMSFRGTRKTSSDSAEYAWMVWTPKSNAVSMMRVLETTPLEERTRRLPAAAE